MHEVGIALMAMPHRRMREEPVMSDRMVDRETERNEQRTVDVKRDESPTVVEVVEDAVSTFARPLANQRPGTEDAARQRAENDAEQR